MAGANVVDAPRSVWTGSDIKVWVVCPSQRRHHGASRFGGNDRTKTVGKIMTMEAGSIQFSIGSVLSSSFGVYARNFVSFTVLGLIIGVVNLAFELLFAADPAAAAAETVDYVPIIVGFLISVLVGGLTQAAVIYGTFQDMRGSKAGLGDCIVRGLSAVVPVIVASIIYSLAVFIGSLLLVIPGIIIIVLWWLYVPAIVVERKSIFESFGRSAELTKGRRWQILGLGLVIFVLLLIIFSVIGFVLFGAMMESPGGELAEVPLWVTILNYAISAIVTVFLAVVTAVSYYYLRAEKEGVGIEDLASVFD
jgi:Membrane domain of glycerophosphoryl diester phosphodiesterase